MGPLRRQVDTQDTRDPSSGACILWNKAPQFTVDYDIDNIMLFAMQNGQKDRRACIIALWS